MQQPVGIAAGEHLAEVGTEGRAVAETKHRRTAHSYEARLWILASPATGEARHAAWTTAGGQGRAAVLPSLLVLAASEGGVARRAVGVQAGVRWMQRLVASVMPRRQAAQ